MKPTYINCVDCKHNDLEPWEYPCVDCGKNGKRLFERSESENEIKRVS